MEKSEIQTEWDKIKTSNLIKIKTIQKKHLEQLRTLKPNEYKHNCHVILGWYHQESFDHVLVRDITSGGIYKMALWAYAYASAKAGAEDKYNYATTTEEQASLENMVRGTFDQIFI